MRDYDRSKPLIFCHVPKTAGTSVRQVFQAWYGKNLYQHYKRGPMPPRHDLANPATSGQPVVVFGHFNMQRGFGCEDYYGNVTQHATLLRDPWDRVISNYHYHVKNPDGVPKFSKVADLSLEEYLEGWPYADPDYGPPMANFLPRACDLSNYREMLQQNCIAIAIQEDLPASISRMAERLGFDFDPEMLPRLNTTSREKESPDHLLPSFRKRCALDYAIYEFGCELDAK